MLKAGMMGQGTGCCKLASKRGIGCPYCQERGKAKATPREHRLLLRKRCVQRYELLQWVY